MLDDRPLIFVNKEQGDTIGSHLRNITKKYEFLPLDSKELSMDCYHLLMHFVDAPQHSNRTQDPLYQRYVEPVIREMEQNFASELTVQKLSNLVFISPQYLSRLFGRFLGCSCYEYLTSYRISKAKELLLIFPHLEIQEIACRVGFPDSSHFIAMFKKIAGITPRQFRLRQLH